MIWLILITITLIVFNIINLIYVLKKNKMKRNMFNRYRAKFNLVGDDYTAAIKIHKQFIKEYNEAGGNYQVDVIDKTNNILGRN